MKNTPLGAQSYARAIAFRFLKTEVLPSELPDLVSSAFASYLVDVLVKPEGMPPAYPGYEYLTEKVLMMWGSDYTFRSLPDGSWVVLVLPEVIGGEPDVWAVIDAPDVASCDLPEVTLVTA
jgi:hypothetical protein